MGEGGSGSDLPEFTAAWVTLSGDASSDELTTSTSAGNAVRISSPLGATSGCTAPLGCR